MTHVAVLIPYLEERLESGMVAQVQNSYVEELLRSDGPTITTHLLTGGSWGGLHNQLCRAHLSDSDYLLLANDDCPIHPGAIGAAVAHLRRGEIPGCRFLTVDGEPLDPSYDAKPAGEETPWTRLFLLTPGIFEKVGPLMDLSWFVDIDYCQRLREAGFRITMCDSFTFTHLDAPRTWATPEVVAAQREEYHRACRAAGRSPLV